MDQVAIELEEAAWVDGANNLKSLIHIVMPLMIPGLCTIGIHSFTSSWGNSMPMPGKKTAHTAPMPM